MTNLTMNGKKLAYKGFSVDENNNLNCRGYIFEVGQIYTINGEIGLCRNGFHFCWELNNVHTYYSFSNSVIGVIEILGEIKNEENNEKSVTDKFKLIKLLTKEEVLKISNTGSENTGFMNSGNRNSGYRNSGNRNSGDRNSGDRNSGYGNSGDRNSGNRNSGDRNSGDWNSGDRNSGDWNSGDMNSGDWNSGDMNSGYRNSGNMNSGYWNSGDRNSGYRNSGDRNSGYGNSGDMNSGNWNSGDMNSGNRNSGYFNTIDNKCFLFDVLSEYTAKEFIDTEFYNALTSSNLHINEWIEYTEEEKKNDKTKELIGGYLKTYKYKEACKKWWDSLTEENKQIIQQIPNFTNEKFFEITGINLNK